MSDAKFYVLTFEYFDKSAFYVCGVTQNYIAALTWLRAGDGQHHVYQMELDHILDHTTGHKPFSGETK